MAAAGAMAVPLSPLPKQHAILVDVDGKKKKMQVPSVFQEVLAAHPGMDKKRLQRKGYELKMEARAVGRKRARARDNDENVSANKRARVAVSLDEAEVVAASVLVDVLLYRMKRGVGGVGGHLTVDDFNAFIPVLLASYDHDARTMLSNLCGLITVLNCGRVYAAPMPAGRGADDGKKFMVPPHEKVRANDAIDNCLTMVAAMEVAAQRLRGVHKDDHTHDVLCYRSPCWVPPAEQCVPVGRDEWLEGLAETNTMTVDMLYT